MGNSHAWRGRWIVDRLAEEQSRRIVGEFSVVLVRLLVVEDSVAATEYRCFAPRCPRKPESGSEVVVISDDVS